MARTRFEDFVQRPEASPGTRASSTAVRADVRPTAAEIDTAIRRLPALPALLHELMRELRDADADIHRLEERISSDASLTTRVLKMANSPFYARSGEVVDVGRAVMTLGFRTVANLVMAAGLRNTMAKVESVPTFERNGVFTYSLASGIVCGRLSRKVPALRPVADELFVAGLLHDVGRIAMSDFYARVADEIGAHPKTALHPPGELELLGTDHQAVGALVRERWGLPDELVGAITRHHEAIDTIRDEPVVLAVALVDAALELKGYARTFRNDAAAGRLASLCAALDTDDETVLGILDQAQDEVSSIAGSFA